jgi:2-keto-4-pentenoate hydratase/2-oxohepta-3-ene-1,7-dioic acid hydratase in catechol pathway
VRIGERIHDISWFGPSNEVVITLLAEGIDTLEDAAQAPSVAAADVALLPPLLEPGKIICVGINYASHADETGSKRADFPVLFPRWPNSLVGYDEPLLMPSVSEQLDYEGELVAVIGRGGRNIPRETALDHVFGYSIFNDASVRDYQRRTSQFTPGKNFDGTGGFGPEIVTADELPPGAAGLRLQTRVAGETLQDASTAELIFDVGDLVHLVSTVMTLEPADIIVTGTPAGVGAARKPPRWLRVGEVVEVEIEGIGILRNFVKAGP